MPLIISTTKEDGKTRNGNYMSAFPYKNFIRIISIIWRLTLFGTKEEPIPISINNTSNF